MQQRQVQIKTFSTLLLALSLTASTGVLAQNSGNSSGGTVQINPKSTESTSDRLKQLENQNRYNNPTGASINDAANKTKDSNKMAKVISTATGVAMIALGVWQLKAGCHGDTTWGCAVGPMSIAMGGQALAQAGANSGASKSAGMTGLQTSGWGSLGENTGTDPLADSDVQKLINVPQAKDAIAQAKKLGIQLNKPKINGKDYKTSDFANKESMMAAGLPASAIDGALKNLSGVSKEISKKVGDSVEKIGAHTSAMGFNEDAPPATSSSNSSGTSESGVALGEGGVGLGKLDRDPAGAHLAGLSKDFNGEPIGVSADSIFNMMSRRYKLKEKQNTFIDQSH